MPAIDKQVLRFAKELRREMTPAEARLWFYLRAKRLEGIKFVRQSVRRRYIADFLARSRKLVIEVDGDTHAGSEAYDQRRTRWLEANGYRVLRIANAEVMGNIEGVLSTILATLHAGETS